MAWKCLCSSHLGDLHPGDVCSVSRASTPTPPGAYSLPQLEYRLFSHSIMCFGVTLIFTRGWHDPAKKGENAQEQFPIDQGNET